MRCCEVLERVDRPWAGKALSASSRQERSQDSWWRVVRRRGGSRWPVVRRWTVVARRSRRCAEVGWSGADKARVVSAGAKEEVCVVSKRGGAVQEQQHRSRR